jgi:diaminopropionate ammonia-lyase
VDARVFQNRVEAVTQGPYPFEDLLSLRDGLDAREVIGNFPYYIPTPLTELRDVAIAAGVARVFYKDEGERFDLHSFKILGAGYAVARLLQNQVAAHFGTRVSIADLISHRYGEWIHKKVFTCATAGNHGRAVAAVARLFGARCKIFLPASVSDGRRRSISDLGADVVRVQGDYDAAVRFAAKSATVDPCVELICDTSWSGYESVPLDIMRGYSVLMLEAAQQLLAAQGALTHVFVQGGVGGLAASVCAHLWQTHGSQYPFVTVVEPETADCLFQSARAGVLRSSSGDLTTVMGGLACGEVSRAAWRILSKGAHAFIKLSDAEAIAAMRILASPQPSRPAIVAGESGAAGLAGLLACANDPRRRAQLNLNGKSQVLLIGTEGATDPELYANLITAAVLPK